MRTKSFFISFHRVFLNPHAYAPIKLAEVQELVMSVQVGYIGGFEAQWQFVMKQASAPSIPFHSQ